ncbi:hypothetical protein Q5741_16050 [Paenibacillus sp. JX-17]|uniref:Lantibiotic n=1 Tax=Paenibacillus lacisoli TaxID=3064525 RepID=A0ABT9CF73_9BACL|nr:hypothetical protein [Paenibacillus sp. JX-17]MDO7907926.1 hypothetical protein [Paenibacillus sp. JX-17]
MILKTKLELELELYAEEIIEEDLETNFSCCWGTFACFSSSGTSSAGTGSTGACGC